MLIVSELYYPEDKSTGYFVAGIAESLASAGWPVRVLCAQPAALSSKKALPESESRAGVQIKRIAAPGADKNRLGQRGWRIACLTARFALAILREVRRGEPVLVVTNPPTLPWIVSAVAARRRSPSVLLVHDVYPDALVATGLVRRDGFLCRLLNIVQRHSCTRFLRIIVLGRDVKARLAKKFPEIASRIEIIPNWADAEEVQCRPRSGNPLRERLGLSQNFVIQFSGNLGRTHGIDDLLSLARELREEPRVKFLLSEAMTKSGSHSIFRTSFTSAELR
jgi:glycosyltransferase involved in cell wall biosynthesis